VPPPGLLVFSFRHVDRGNPKFSLANCAIGYAEKLIERLQALSGMTWREFRENKSRALRAHSIDWAATTEPDGFLSLNFQLREVQAFQFEVSVNEHGRIHGFLVDFTFYVVWFDPDHRLYR